MKRFKLFIMALILVAMAGVPAFATDTLKIGAVGTLSGGGTEWGIATKRGVQLAIDEVNAAGGLKVGKKTYNLEMVMYDDQYTGQGGTTAATRLVNLDNVKYIIGPIGSPAVLGVLGVTKPAKVLVLSNGFSPKILTKDSKYNFRIANSTNEFAPAIIKWLRKEYPNAKRMGVISPNDAVGHSVLPILLKAYEDNGFEVVFEEKYDRGLNDFSALITRMMTKNVEIFEIDSNAPGEAGMLVKQARQFGFKGTIIQTGGPGYDEVIRIAGDRAEGFLSYDIFDPTAPVFESFVNGYNSKYKGESINPYAPLMYNGTKLLFEAIRRAGTIEVDAVQKKMESLEGFDSIFGKVHWGGKDLYGINHQLLVDLFVSKVKNGKIKPYARISQ